MPKDKDLKRLVRERMSKTGESYTTARARLLEKKVRAAPPTLPDDYETLAGMSDEAVRSKTGLTWSGWVAALDAHDAASLPHPEIVRRLKRDHPGVSDWWAQMITVGYERLCGLRAPGQRRDGTYQAGRSRTVAVPVARVYRAFAEPREREVWLGDVGLEVRTARKDRSMRIAWPDGTFVSASFTSKGPSKSRVAVDHEKLPDAEAAAAAKTFWGERLAALVERLEAESGD
jgi:hypothetical protein